MCMDSILIKCVSGFKTNLNDFVFQPGKLKQHSDLEINRLIENIKNDGFLFPIIVSKVNDKLYIIDGECRVLALHSLMQQGFEIPEIPYCLTKATEDTIKKITIDNCSTNHSVTQFSLQTYCEGTNIQLKKYGFPVPSLIDFREMKYIELYDSALGGKIETGKVKLKKEEFMGLLLQS